MAGGDAYVSETILANIRILAIDQQISEKSGEAAVVARETATLELAPAQAETMTQAMQLGTISLALRSIADAAQTAETDTGTQSGAVKVVRYGVVTKVTTRK
jgi:pilus assembly protein CpaB